MFPMQAQAMLSGADQGQREAMSALPSQFQNKGVSEPRNPFEGSLNQIAQDVLNVAALLNKQGDHYRGCVEDLYGLAFKLKKVNNDLTDIVQDGAKKDAGY